MYYTPFINDKDYAHLSKNERDALSTKRYKAKRNKERTSRRSRANNS